MVSKFNKEVEIKLSIDENIASKLKEIELTPYEEIDEYFFTEDNVGKDEFLRLRRKNGKIALELKMITLGGKDAEIYEANEIETEISDKQYETIKQIFGMIFPVKIQVKKVRSKGSLNGCELCYDRVEELGEYLEIEGPKDNIMQICSSFGIDIEKNRDRSEGYAKMMLKKRGYM